MQVPLAKCKTCGWILAFALFIDSSRFPAADVTLSWQASSTTNVTGYFIYYGTASRTYTGKIMAGKVTTTTISNLNCGTTYYFSATALDSRGDESGFSNETKFLVPGAIVLSMGENPGVPMATALPPAIASLLGARVNPPKPMVINVPVAPSHWYEIQATEDFKSWTTVSRTGVATSNAWVQCSDPFASAYSSRFYRLVIH